MGKYAKIRYKIMIRLSELIDMGAVGLRESADLPPLFLLVTAEFSPFLTPLEPYAVNALRDFFRSFFALKGCFSMTFLVYSY